MGFSLFFFFFCSALYRISKLLHIQNSIASFSVIRKAELLLLWLRQVLAVACRIFSYGMGNPSSPAGDRTGATCMGSSESAAEPPGEVPRQSFTLFKILSPD